jgi:hypothetical protein
MIYTLGDLGLSVIYDRIWLYYSGLHTHYLDRASLSPDDLTLFERCIAFLQTDLEYEGALLRHRQPLSHLVKRLLRGSEEQTTIFSPQTEEASSFITPWWPFASADQYEEALADREES